MAPRRRRKTMPKIGCPNQDASHHKSFLDRIPMEILAEILSYTASPRDILALSRCSKYFCATLVDNPASVFIWKYARERCKPEPIPDPTPNWAEPSYASFIFDGGNCEVCGKGTAEMYWSFSLRVRLCTYSEWGVGPVGCLEKWLRERSARQGVSITPTPHLPILNWVPRVEPCLLAGFSHYNIFVTRKLEWESYVDAFNKANLSEEARESFLAGKVHLAERLKLTSDLNTKLVMWREQVSGEALTVKTANIKFAKTFAAKLGWGYFDLTLTPTYSSLFRCKNVCLETITPNDLDLVQHRLEGEIVAIREARKRRQDEEAHRQARLAVAKRHSLLTHKANKIVVPPLETFRQLDTLKLVVRQSDAPALLTKGTFEAALSQDVAQWVGKAQAALGKLLGYPDWKNPSALKAHVVERVNARFLCKKCPKFSRMTGFKDPGMDFTDACRHTCAHLSKKQKARTIWSADDFVADTHFDQVIGAINQVLSQAGIDPELDAAKKQVEKLGDIITCYSCPSPIMMSFEVMLRHCRRHDAVKFKVVSPEEASAILQNHAIPHGQCQRLVNGPESLRKTPSFVCRHCVGTSDPPAKGSTFDKPANVVQTLRPIPEETPAVDKVGRKVAVGGSPPSASGIESASVMSTSDVPTGSMYSPEKEEVSDSTKAQRVKRERQKRRAGAKVGVVYTFDAFRSHAKAKHGVTWIGDEDFYRAGAD